MIKSFTVKKSKWARGDINGDSALLNDGGYMCCLGFLGKACKVKNEKLIDVELPSECEDHKKFPRAIFNKWDTKNNKLKKYYPLIYLTDFEDALVHFNDETGISDEERIEILQEIFSYKGIKMKVVE